MPRYTQALQQAQNKRLDIESKLARALAQLLPDASDAHALCLALSTAIDEQRRASLTTYGDGVPAVTEAGPRPHVWVHREHTRTDLAVQASPKDKVRLRQGVKECATCGVISNLSYPYMFRRPGDRVWSRKSIVCEVRK